MSYKYYDKSSTDCAYKSGTAKYTKIFKNATPRKVIPSKTLGPCATGASYSDGIIIKDWQHRPRKATQSNISFSGKSNKNTIDYCKKCGDQVHSNGQSSNSDKSQSSKSNNIRKPSNNNPKIVKKIKCRTDSLKLKPNGTLISNGVKQYYKNENFKSTISLQDTEAEFRKMSLDTIKEVPEIHAASGSGVNIFNVLSDSEEGDIRFLDLNDSEKIRELKQFREDNYFECHSVKSRIDNKGSVTSLIDHKCMYRFYLNDRLFPVPVSTDHHDNIRCVQCHLPITLNMDDEEINKANGTIQAKVRLNDGEAQDMVLLLPVKDSLIIKERRKRIQAKQEVLYFGVIKLGAYGNSVFNSTLPSDSLALKYQKGYEEYGSSQNYKYTGVEREDVIVL